jgi:two-component sensor histidine kinase
MIFSVNELTLRLLALLVLLSGALAEVRGQSTGPVAAPTGSASLHPQTNPPRRFPKVAPERATAPASTNPPPRRWVVEGDSADTRFAARIGPAGDVNGDGFSDVFIAESCFNSRQGRVLVHSGSAEGLAAKPKWILIGNRAFGLEFGDWVEGVGDVDHDGYDDVVVKAKAPGEDPGSDPGEAASIFLFRGSPAGPQPNTAWSISSRDFGVMGIRAAGRAGDVNGDGFADIYVLASIAVPGGTGFRVLIFHGGPARLARTPAVSWEVEGAPFAGAPQIACAGDLNGDGCDDLAVGSAWWIGASKSAGRVFVHYGGKGGLSSQPGWAASYPLPIRKGIDDPNEQFFGWSVASAGDVNGDGFADLIIGAPYADHDDVNEGLAFVYCGSASGLSHKPSWFVESNHAHSLLGWSVSTAGNVNHDGFDDVVIGVPYATDGQYNEGAALVFLGSKSGLARSPHWSVESDNTQQFMGKVVAAAGDVNGDGFDDVLVAAPDFLREGKKVGRVCLYYGSARGLPHSFNWSLEKPALASIQERLDHVSPSLKWSTVGGLLTSSVVLLFAWRRAVARQRTAELETARVLERERLARDLHDELGASLARLALIEKPGNSLGAENVSDQVQQALRATEQVVWAVNPANDTLENLVAFLFVQADRIFAGTSIRCVTRAPLDLPQVDLEPEFRKNVFLATKEALTNALKHSQAREVVMAVAYADGVLEISVEDNGVGVYPGSVRPFGNGLKNMRQRLEASGGTFEVSSSGNRGTRVVLRAPLPDSR